MTASTVITLDTRPPLVLVTAITQVEPPADWLVTLDSDEPIGPVSLRFEDAMGLLHPLGFTTNAQQVVITVPTADLASGPGALVGSVSDQVGNVAVVRVPLSINRKVIFTAELTMDHLFEAQMHVDHAFDMELTVDHGFEAEMTIEGD